MELNPAHSIRELVEQAHQAGKGVHLHLTTGTTVAGRIGGVGQDHIVLSELVGREFYGALIRIEHVVAVEVRLRDR